MIEKEIRFKAEFVEACYEVFTPDYAVYGIYFGEGDPEQGGQHWSFSQSVGDDDNEGVCTVKEIQQVTVYGGISKFHMDRKQIVCDFDPETESETHVGRLVVQYELSSEDWSKLCETAKKVFESEEYFEIHE